MRDERAVDVSDGIPTKNREIIAWRVIAGQAVAVDLREAAFHLLNPVATRIWEMIDGTKSMREITDALLAEFDVGREELERDCVEFINQMTEKNLLLMKGAPE